MHRRFRSNRFELDDSNRYDEFFSDDFEDKEEINPEVKQVFEESQEHDYGTDQWLEEVSKYNARKPKLAGGDRDADWEVDDGGEETVAGENPTQDRNADAEEGEAVGIRYRDNDPLRTTEKPKQHDRKPWQLDLRSSPAYRKRVREKFNAQTQSSKSTGKTTPEKMDQRKNPRKQVHTQNGNRRTKQKQKSGPR